MHDTHRCAICSAEFGSTQDLVKHERSEHRRGADSSGQDEEVAPESGSPTHREGREFSRRHAE